MIVNGKEYPLWSQFVERKNEWIGGLLEEIADSFPFITDRSNPATKIVDITLEANGTDSAKFEVIGEAFTCAGDVRYLGIIAGDEGWITLSGYGGHEWRIKQKNKL